MPAIIDTVPNRVTRSNTYISDEDRVLNKKMKQLKKEQDRAARDSKNRGGKLNLRQQARRNSFLEEKQEEQENKEQEEQTEKYYKNIHKESIPVLEKKRVLLKRHKRKPGHRDNYSTVRF